ncbi:MAG TPA: DUF2809 domain-containing protein [Chitinophagaceae bacterium]|nr:DUF2809 domain-containing protein [Chitinophagaceae bacterium]
MQLLTFNYRYFLLALIIFVVEVLIALFVHDSIIRPYGGDYLVVILIYAAVRTCIHASPLKIALGVLLFSFTLEVLQYYHIVDRLGLSDNRLARTVIGHGFSWWDMLAYTLGVITILIVENAIRRVHPAL